MYNISKNIQITTEKQNSEMSTEVGLAFRRTLLSFMFTTEVIIGGNIE